MTFSIIDYRKGSQIDSALLKLGYTELSNGLLSVSHYGEKIQFLNRDHPFKCPECGHTGNFNPHQYLKDRKFGIKYNLYYIKDTPYVWRVYSLAFDLQCLKCSVKGFVETEIELKEVLRMLREEKEFIKGKERPYKAYIV